LGVRTHYCEPRYKASIDTHTHTPITHAHEGVRESGREGEEGETRDTRQPSN